MAHRSLANELNAAAAGVSTPGGSIQIGEVNVGAANPNTVDDDAHSNCSMNTVRSSASTFAGGNREIDAYLRNGKIAIEAAITRWLAMRAPYANKSHDDVEAMGEDAATAAEDVDQLRYTTGNNIRKWISTARMELNKNDETDRHILHRICTYVDQKRRTFEKNGYIMTKVVTGEMKQQCQ